MNRKGNGAAAVGRALGGVRQGIRAGVRRGVLYLAALGFTLFAVMPFYWMFLTAFKQNQDLYVGATDPRHVPWIFNDPPTLDHVRLLLRETPYLTWLQNTLFVGALVVLITVVVAVPAGYSLARLAGPRGEKLGVGIFLTYLIPPTLLFLPLSRVIATLGLQDSLWALVLTYPTFTIPFCTWLLMGFFRAIPREIEEQAMIDGYSRLAAMVRVVLPLALPGVLTAAIFAFALVMQEFVYALTFVSSVEKMTVSLGVPVSLVRGDVFFWGSLMAACLLTSLPIAVVYNLLVDRFVAGLTAGAVKG